VRQNLVPIAKPSALISSPALAAGAMVTAVLADYPQDVGRGKVGGAVGIVAGLGALTAVFIFLHIPAWTKLDDMKAAGDTMFFVVGGFSAFCALILFIGLKPGRPNGAQVRPLSNFLNYWLCSALNFYPEYENHY